MLFIYLKLLPLLSVNHTQAIWKCQIHVLHAHNIEHLSYLLVPIWALWYVAALFSVCLKFDQKFRRFGDYLKFYLWCANSDDTIVFRVPEYPFWRNCMSIERAVRPKSTNVGITRFSGQSPLSTMLTRFLRIGWRYRCNIPDPP